MAMDVGLNPKESLEYWVIAKEPKLLVKRFAYALNLVFNTLLYMFFLRKTGLVLLRK
jgi:hypothetical protein